MILKYAFVACLLVTPALGQEAPSPTWHLFTQSNGGTISLLHGLTKSTCEYAKNRALGLAATDAERESERKLLQDQHENAIKFCATAKPGQRSGTGLACNADGSPNWATVPFQARMVGPGDIMRAECFQ